MSGDVFGNGMLLSPATRLVAAFDHRDIFIDPIPDPAISFAERKRLFDLPRSCWQDYDKALISQGGGVFSRSAQGDPARAGGPQPARPRQGRGHAVRGDDGDPEGAGRTCSGSAASAPMSARRPRATIRPATAPTIAIRITGADVRARVIGEGANLGVTQRGRIEAAQKGVRLNTDAIDNSAGVNTSDVEVNIKIALARPEREGRLSSADRNSLLAAMTDEVGALVLRNNYLQTLALSLAERRGVAETGFLSAADADRSSSAACSTARSSSCPTTPTLAERTRRGEALTRPGARRAARLRQADALRRPAGHQRAGRSLSRPRTGRVFPARGSDRFPDAVELHRLRREIIATSLANAVINRGGPACRRAAGRRDRRRYPDHRHGLCGGARHATA